MTLKDLGTLESSSKGASYTIANILREAIYQGIFQENDPLPQSQIAEQLGVSPIPLREALKQLESEGLVAFRGRKGAMVTGLSLEEAREIYDMLMWVECGLFKVAFPYITRSLLQEESRLLDAMEQEENCINWRDMNVQFHSGLYEPADRPTTQDTICTLRRQVDRYIRTHLTLMREESEQQHRAILQATIDGDMYRAVAALQDHLENTSKNLQAHMRRRHRS